MKFDSNSDAKTITECSCPGFAYEHLPCKHMFLLARWDPDYTVNGDHRPQRLDIKRNPSTPNSSPLPVVTERPIRDTPSLSSSSHASSSSASPTNDETPPANPRDSMKAAINKFKRTFEQSAFPSDRLLDIMGKLEDLHTELQQAIILPPNASLPTQHQRKKRRTTK